MKNIKKYIILFLVFTTSTLLFNNCKKEIDTNFQKNSSLSEDKNADFLTEGETILIDKPYTFSDLFIFPVGTELSIIDNKLVYKLPEGFALLAKVLMPDGTIQIKQQTGGNCIFTCDVNTDGQSGGCSPIVNSKNGDCGCEMTEAINEGKALAATPVEEEVIAEEAPIVEEVTTQETTTEEV